MAQRQAKSKLGSLIARFGLIKCTVFITFVCILCAAFNTSILMMLFGYKNFMTGILIAIFSTSLIAPPLFYWVFGIVLELHETKEKLFRLSHYDELTGLANRYYLFSFAETLFRRCRRVNSSVSLILIDIDHFKKYNDYYGHIAGDECLRKIGGILKDNLKRPDDLAARFGGEEFLVVLGNTDVDGALKVARSLQQSLSDLAIPNPESGVAEYVTMSMGCVSAKVDAETSFSELLTSADKQLYKAKDQGRNMVSW